MSKVKKIIIASFSVILYWSSYPKVYAQINSKQEIESYKFFSDEELKFISQQILSELFDQFLRLSPIGMSLSKVT